MVSISDVILLAETVSAFVIHVKDSLANASKNPHLVFQLSIRFDELLAKARHVEEICKANEMDFAPTALAVFDNEIRSVHKAMNDVYDETQSACKKLRSRYRLFRANIVNR